MSEDASNGGNGGNNGSSDGQAPELPSRWDPKVLIRTPCFRESMMSGILAGFMGGAVWGAKTLNQHSALNAGLLTFAVSSVVTWEYCTREYQAQQERMITIVQLNNAQAARKRQQAIEQYKQKLAAGEIDADGNPLGSSATVSTPAVAVEGDINKGMKKAVAEALAKPEPPPRIPKPWKNYDEDDDFDM